MDIATMPRGGFDASWLDRRLQTDRPEFLDRDDIDDRIKRGVIRWLDRMGRICGITTSGRARPAARQRIVRAENSRIGAGHGALSQAVLDMHRPPRSRSPTSTRLGVELARVTWAPIRVPLCARWTPQTSMPPTAPTTWRCLPWRSTICRRFRPPGCWPKGPAWPTSWSCATSAARPPCAPVRLASFCRSRSSALRP